MFQLFGLILKKIHLNVFFYQLLKKTFRLHKRYCMSVKPYTESEVKNAYELLSQFHHDVKSSCLASNKIEKKYDIQIIVPVYNVEKYIIDCIDSVLQQNTKYSYCLTIINDGSPDNSRNLLKRYENISLGNSVLVEIIDQENKGFSGARNAGLKHIKGKYITFLDSDDKLHPGAIDAFLDSAIKYDADIVQGGYLSISSSGKVRKSYPCKFSISQNNDSHLVGFTCSKAFKSDLFAFVKFPEKYWFEDTICSYFLFQLAGTRVSIDKYVYEYRKNEQSITFTSRGKNKSLDTLYITQALIKDALNYDFFFSDRFYARQFQQIKGNCCRLNALKNYTIEHAAFVIHCHLIEKYFPNRKLESTDFSVIEMYAAIKNHNYQLYKLVSYLL